MAAGDGKYITLAELKLYGLGEVADPLNPTVYNGSVATTPDDSVLTQSIKRAEMEFDRIAGIQFNQQTLTLVSAFLPFVDGEGWLNIFAREVAPVTAVAALQYRDLKAPGEGWKTITLNADDVILPINDGYAHPDSARVRIYNSNIPAPRSTGEILIKWTYTGGFSTTPDGVKALICRLAWWIYKLREAPLYKIVSAELGIMQIPLRIPPDVNQDILLWQPAYA